MRPRAEPLQATAPGAQRLGQLQARRGYHQGADHARQQGLEFAVVALMGVGQMPAAGEDERDEARLFYVGATRATHRLAITVSGSAQFGQNLT